MPPNGNGADPRTYSLPRVNGGGSGGGYSSSPMAGGPVPAGGGGGGVPGYHPGYSSYDRRLPHGGYGHHPAGSPQRPPDYAPDHYFMPSQRKYSGEFVRVYVDYNK